MIAYTEMFYSVQGEGLYTGHASVFFRLWGCNLQCHGFGQKDPTNPDTWVLDFKDYDPKAHGIKSVEELPVWKHGCDSSYTWAHQYRHLALKESAADICNKILDLLPNRDWGSVHLVFTGGEPMMNQGAILEIMNTFNEMGKSPISATIETNGTKPLKEFVSGYGINFQQAFRDTELCFSVSPKLHHVTGEKPEKTQRPEVIESYYAICDNIWIKPVVVDTDACWSEVDSFIGTLNDYCIDAPIFIMPCGATQEEQEQTGYMKSIAEKALQRGWNVSARMHVWIFGNAVGT